ncbi:MAG: 1,4-alpha-glucan-branching enzyme, partial [Bacteroidaceae bacterium]|nr:1,4-alpha-glucan-branching enzyme [Bacteroidaceae bacterium]
MKPMLRILENDPWLQPYAPAIEGRQKYYEQRLAQLTHNGKQTLSEFAQGHLYYGLHRTPQGWAFREWAPNATRIFLVGDFNGWAEMPAYELKRLNLHGDWEILLPADAIQHGQHYKMKVYWEGGSGERIPAYVRRVVQDEQTKLFSAQVWEPETPFVFKTKRFRP